jgi:nitroreductase
MDLYDVMRTTGAVRHFTDDPLPDEVLHRILDHARFAPSGGNRQGAQVVVVRARETREALVRLVEPAARRYAAQGAAGESPWNPVDPPGPTQAEIEATEVPRHLTQPLLDAAVVLVFCLDLRRVAAMDQHLGRIGIVGGGSIYPLVWNTLLAARNEGFGGTITTMAVAAEDGVKALLGIPEEYAVAAVVPMGRPVKQVSRLSRNEVEDFTHVETWTGGPLRP